MTVRFLILVWVMSMTLPVVAGLDIDQYLMPQENTLTEEEMIAQRKAVQAQIEEARRRDQERAEQQRQARKEEEARLAARPVAVRLTELRCLTCHTLENLETNPQSRIGWEITVRRMQWFNDAKLEEGERAVIVHYLAETYPAKGWRRFDAVLLMSGLAALFILIVFIMYRLITSLILNRK